MIQATSCMALLFCASPALLEGDQGDRVPVTFSYRDPTAGSVCAAGDFNRWSANSHCLTKEGEVWRREIQLPRGRYGYLYRVDDRGWILDPAATLLEESGFGARNAVLVVA